MIFSRHVQRAAMVLLGSLVAVAGIGLTTAEAAPNWLATRGYFNDPRATGDASNVTRNLVIHHFDHAPAGSLVRGTTWNLTDTAISDAMVRAIKPGRHGSADRRQGELRQPGGGLAR